MNPILVLTFSVILLFSKICNSCSAPDEELFLAPDRMLMKTSGVVLARAISITPNYSGRENMYNSVEFEVIEVLSGTISSKKLIVKGLSEKGVQSDYNKHQNLEFWASSLAGNGKTHPDCNTYGAYEIGNTYLMYLDVTNTKAFERIVDLEDDRWLNLTRFMIESEKTRIKKHNEINGYVEPDSPFIWR